MNLEEVLREKKGSLKDSTLATYVTNLTILHKMITNSNTINNIDFAKEADKILEYLSKYQPNTRKSYLNALITLLKCDVLGESDACKRYIEERDTYNKMYQDQQATGELTDKQKKNWISWDAFKEMIVSIEKDVKNRKLKTRSSADVLDAQDMKLYEDLILTKLYEAMPVRNDYANVKVITSRRYAKLNDKEKKCCNYLVTKTNAHKLVLNHYKTEAKYGEKVFEITPKLSKLITGWLKHNKSGELLHSIHDPNGITKALNRITKARLGKTLGSSMLRHIYLSSKYSDLEAEKKKDADLMMHSKSTAEEIYIKKPPES